jgi:hypothetical protein
MHIITHHLEKRWYYLWAFVWAIALMMAIIGYTLYGYFPSKSG